MDSFSNYFQCIKLGSEKNKNLRKSDFEILFAGKNILRNNDVKTKTTIAKLGANDSMYTKMKKVEDIGAKKI